MIGKSLQTLTTRLLWLAGLALCCANTFAQPPLTSVNSASSQQEKPRLWCSQSFGDAASFNDVQTAPENEWRRIDGHTLSGQFKSNPTWCQFTFQAQDSANWVFGFANAQIDQVDVVYVFDSITKIEGGSGYRFSERELITRHLFFPIPEANTPITVFFRVQDPALFAPVLVMTEGRLYERERSRIALGALSFGMILPIVVLLFLTRKMADATRKKQRTMAVVMALAYTLTSMVYNGYGFNHIWGERVLLNQTLRFLSVSGFLVLSWWYLQVLYERHFKLWSYAITAVGLASLLISLGLLISKEMALVSALIIATDVHLGLFLVALVYLQFVHGTRSKHRSWFVWNLFNIANLAVTVGLVPFGTDLDLITSANFFLFTALVGHSIAMLIQHNQKELIAAVEEKLDQEMAYAQLQRQRNEELEGKVTERTQELSRMMRELHMSNVKLRSATNTDALTGIMNRYACDVYIDDQWKRCEEKQLPFSFAFIDADHFKKVNDTYGHDTGDACLQQLATMITNSLTQPSMRVARYGGEEFIVIAPGTPSGQLASAMESLRAVLEDTPIIHGELNFNITVSIGIASADELTQTNPRETLKQADNAVYAAKNQGRNRVINAQDLPENV
jgi:diguanylate cyclase (GGDEF)-like protein